MRAPERARDAAAHAAAREDPSVRNAEAEARAAARQDPSVRAPERARDAAARRSARRAGDGPLYLAAPEDMPPDSYLATHEQNPIAAQALFWANTYNWKFERWRDTPFDASMPSDEVAALVAAMNEEAEVTYADIERCTARYLRRCPPGQPAQACAACGTCDVPVVHSTVAEADRVGVTHFHTVPFFQDYGQGVCLNADLKPLVYTREQDEAYNRVVPSHVVDTDDNRRHWARFRDVQSSLELREPASNRLLRLHLYPELCGLPPAGCGPQPDNAYRLPAVGEDPALAGHLRLCNPCYQRLRVGQVPEPSVAAGWDLGSAARVGLPTLSWAETRAISRCRPLSAAFTVRLPRRPGQYHTLTGNCACFHDNAADECSAALPDALFAGREVCLY